MRAGVRTAPVRVLDDRDLPEVLALLATDPVANVSVSARVEAAGLDPWRLGGELWGHVVEGRIRSLCYVGPNVIPVAATTAALRLFAERALRQGRRCSSIVGPAQPVAVLWEHLRTAWGPAREERRAQPLLATAERPAVAADAGVRRVRPAELDVVLPACVAMFTEEVGISPVAADGGVQYRARVAELIAQGRSFARIERGRVLFKAEVGAVSRAACQVQGVWVPPELRGRGLGTAGMAAVVTEALHSVAPVVSLYVNDFNEPARRAYTRVGFREVGTFMSVLF